MLARLWSAHTTPALSDSYINHFEQAVQPQLRQLHGFLGATVCTRPLPGAVEILVITYWQSFAAIDTFAGPDRESDDGGFAVRSGKGVDGGEGLPVGDDQDFDGPRKRTGADGGAEEAVELAKLRLHGLLEMIDIGIGERGSGVCGPEAREHLRRTPRIWHGALRCPRRPSSCEPSSSSPDHF